MNPQFPALPVEHALPDAGSMLEILEMAHVLASLRKEFLR